MKTLDSHSTGKYSSTILISPIIYLLISIGVSLQISGSNWDIVWHGVGNVETFFTPPHSVIYSGVVLAIGSVIGGAIQAAFRIRQQKHDATWFVLLLVPSSLPLSLKIAAIGCILRLTAGPFDFLWHSLFGFDGLLSPPHSVLAVGMLTTALGALIGIYGHYSNQSSKINNISSLSSLFSKLSLIVGFAVFLMVAVGVVLMFTLPFSKGQYFDFNPNPLAAFGCCICFHPIYTWHLLIYCSENLLITDQKQNTFHLYFHSSCNHDYTVYNHNNFEFIFRMAFSCLSIEYNSSFGCRYLDISIFTEKEG